MRTVVVAMLALLASGLETGGQQPAAVLELVEGGRSRAISVQVTIDDVPYDAYWDRSFDAIFSFADANADGTLNATEIRLVPSARALRLSLGTGFVPPVAAIVSMKDVVGNEESTCSRDKLRKYYHQHDAGRLEIGFGNLSNTSALTAALLQMLDDDQDGKLSQAEIQRAEVTLRRLDTNDDELIGVGELVPNGTYPGSWAANSLSLFTEVDLSRSGDRSLVLKWSEQSSDATKWEIKIDDQLRDHPLKLATRARCVSWSVPGPLMALHEQMREVLAEADREPESEVRNDQVRSRLASRAWLTSLVDRNRDGKTSSDELDQWLTLQRQLIHGHLLVSIYYGGGLFELLDTNRDAGLSVRELRAAWRMLDEAACTFHGHVDLDRIPNVALFVVSQGYPDSLARTTRSDVEWFQLMDRNADGDVSRREFTGSPDAFDRLDLDQDGLIASCEAAESK